MSEVKQRDSDTEARTNEDGEGNDGGGSKHRNEQETKVEDATGGQGTGGDAGDVPLSTPPGAPIPPSNLGPPKPKPTPKAGEGKDFTERELHIINDPVAFREFCLVSQRGMLDSLGKVHSEQKAAKNREGQLAAYMALAMLDNAKLHDQFKNKSICRAVAEKMKGLASEAGVEPINIESFAKEHGGPEASMEQKVKPPAKTLTDKKDGHKDGKPTGSKRKEHSGDDEETSAKKGKYEGSSSSRKIKPKDTMEDPNVADEDGITLPGGLHSRENDIILSKWGFKGTGIKGTPGCIIRVPGDGELKLPATVVQAAKSAASVVASKTDRGIHHKLFGATLAKYVETVLDHLVEKKKDHAPFLFEPLVSLETVGGASAPKTLNDAQAHMWALLLRSAYSQMNLRGTEASISLPGLDAAIKLLQKKVDTMARLKNKKPTAPKSSPKSSPKVVDEEDDF